jgi:lipocalin
VAPRPEDSRLVLKIACHKGSVDGTVLPIDGLMVETAPGNFEVRFVRLPQFGNLNLMVLWEASDAGVVVLASPTGDVGWVWSKAAHPDAAALMAAKKVLQDNGYNPEAIALVDQGK